MSAWGPAVFSDDNASDLRDDYRKLIGDGMSSSEATDRLIAQWAPDADPDIAPVFWLALALTQWKCGRLEERVQQRALGVIADGSALGPWLTGPSAAKRRGVLAAAQAQLLSPPPAPVKIAKRVLHTCEWEPGELVAYQMASGAFVIFRILSLWSDAGGTYPDCELLDWQSDRLPVNGVPEETPVRSSLCTLLPLGKRKAAPRFTRLGIKHRLEPKKSPVARVLRMDLLDQQLAQYFDLR